MKIKRKYYSLVAFNPIDYSSTLHYLEEKRKNGWLLTKYYSSISIAQFSLIEQTPIQYGIEIKEIDGPHAAYNSPSLLAYYQEKQEEGWNHACSHKRCHIFYANTQTIVKPLNTQQSSEQWEINKTFIPTIKKSLHLSGLVVIIFLLTAALEMFLSSDQLSFIATYHPLFLLMALLVCAQLIDTFYLIYRFTENINYINRDCSILTIRHNYLCLIPLQNIIIVLLSIGFCLTYIDNDPISQLHFSLSPLLMILSNYLINYKEKYNGKTHQENKDRASTILTILVLVIILYAHLGTRLIYHFINQ